jgi:hypothetical protein
MKQRVFVRRLGAGFEWIDAPGVKISDGVPKVRPVPDAPTLLFTEDDRARLQAQLQQRSMQARAMAAALEQHALRQPHSMLGDFLGRMWP